MCNACGFLCCGSDKFGGCGCDGCFEPECWTEADEDEGPDEYDPLDDEYLHSFPLAAAPCACRPGRFRYVPRSL